MKRRVDALLRRGGLEVGRPGGRWANVRVRRVALPDELATRAARAGAPIWIDVRRIVTPFGFSYADGGWHPYWETLEQHLNEPEAALDSPLATFYSRYRPPSAFAALFPEGGEPIEPLDRFAARDTTVVWTVNQRVAHRLVRAAADRIAWNFNFGPADVEAITREHERLVRILRSMEQHGYRPHEHPDGVIEGFFLIRDDDYRFLPTEGQHRLGAIRALGIEQVLVVPRTGLSGVRYGDLDRWTRRRGGAYTAEGVERLFARYFEVRGAPWAGGDLADPSGTARDERRS